MKGEHSQSCPHPYGYYKCGAPGSLKARQEEQLKELKKQREKTYLVIGQDETDGAMVIHRMDIEKIKELKIHAGSDYCIIDGEIIKTFNGTWNLK